MKCARCPREIEPLMPHEGLCQNCFLDAVEHRTKKALRDCTINKGDTILIIDDNSKESAVSKYLFKKLIDKLPVTILIKKKEIIDLEQAQKEYHHIIIPWDMDDEAETFITNMVNNTPATPSSLIKLLINVYDKEVKLYADIKKFAYTEKEKSKMQNALTTIEQKYPRSQFALLNSIKTLAKNQHKEPVKAHDSA